LNNFSKICREIQDTLKSDKNKRFITRRPLFIDDLAEFVLE